MRVKQLIASSIPGLVTNKQDKIAIVYSASEKQVIETEWTMLGPYKMEAGSAERLQSTMAVSLLFIPFAFILFVLVPNDKPRKWLLGKFGKNTP